MKLISARAAQGVIVILAVAWGALLIWLAQAAQAQPGRGPAADPKRPGKGKELDFRDVTLETKDGVQLHVRYRPAPSGKEGSGKDVVPVLLLHMSKGSSVDWNPLARSLQQAGHAVIVPDLRGHGKSTQVKRGARTATIDQATMNRGQFEAMVTQDMERIKKFIIEENNKGDLNLRKLCVVGAEMGAVVALNWAALDWSWPPLATGPQGQDVNGLVLITPTWSHKGMSIVNATKQPDVQRSISTMIIVGSKDAANLNDARRLHQILQRYHQDYSTATRAVWEEKQDLFFVTPATSLQGTKMLGEPTLGLEGDAKNPGPIRQFIQLRLANKTIPWARRDRPLD